MAKGSKVRLEQRQYERYRRSSIGLPIARPCWRKPRDAVSLRLESAPASEASWIGRDLISRRADRPLEPRDCFDLLQASV